MQDIDESDLIIVAFLAGLGLFWALMALFVAVTWGFPAPKLDVPGILSIVPFWPVYISGVVGPILYRAGLYDDPVVITVAIGVLVGLSVGLLLLILRRRYSLW